MKPVLPHLSESPGKPQTTKPRRRSGGLLSAGVSFGLVSVFFIPTHNLPFASLLSPIVVMTIAGFGFAIAALARLVSLRALRASPVVWWAGGYAFLSVGSFLLFSSEEAVTDLLYRMMSSGILLVSFLWFSNLTHSGLRASRRIFLGLSLLVIASIVLEVSRPPLDSTSFRGGGLFANPNVAASAILIGMVVATEAWSTSGRIAWCLIAGFGILLTQSRGASIVWVLLSAILIFSRGAPISRDFTFRIRSSRSGSRVTLIALGSVLAAGAIVGASALTEAFGRISDRDGYSLGTEDVATSSAESRVARVQAIEFGLERFSEHPIVGNGVGYFHHWDHPQGPHNMYVAFAVDYGVLGLLLIPLLALSTGALAYKRDFRSLAFAIFLILWSLFSHNVVEEPTILVAAAFLAASAGTLPSASPGNGQRSPKIDRMWDS